MRPVVRVGKILKRHLPNLLTSIRDPVTSVTAEGLSRIIEAPSKRREALLPRNLRDPNPVFSNPVLSGKRGLRPERPPTEMPAKPEKRRVRRCAQAGCDWFPASSYEVLTGCPALNRKSDEWSKKVTNGQVLRTNVQVGGTNGQQLGRMAKARGRMVRLEDAWSGPPAGWQEA